MQNSKSTCPRTAYHLFRFSTYVQQIALLLRRSAYYGREADPPLRLTKQRIARLNPTVPRLKRPCCLVKPRRDDLASPHLPSYGLEPGHLKGLQFSHV